MTPDPAPNRHQFSLRTLFGITVLLSLLAAIGGNLVRRSDDVDRLPETVIYVMLALCAPFITLAAAALYRAFTQRGRGKRSDRF
ncbi:MAG: hypothetical protein JNM18_15295 [Planctomycetaceae bacterium]|nr:hypothetical protein [Planctomycetaceae bacterium]